MFFLYNVSQGESRSDLRSPHGPKLLPLPQPSAAPAARWGVGGRLGVGDCSWLKGEEEMETGTAATA